MGGGEASIRSFVAVPVQAPVLDAAEAVQQELREHVGRAGWKVSWTPRDRLHLTLKFLGEVDAGRVGEVAEALEPLAARAPFPIRLGGVGSFPPVGRPRVLWLGVEDGAHDLAAIAEETEARLETIGFSRERRRFHAHLTLGRVKRARGRAEDVLEGFRTAEGGRSTVSEVILYRSDLRPSGAEYTPLARVALRGA